MRFLSFKRPKKNHPKQQKQAAVGLDLKIREIPYFSISTQCLCSACLETHPSPHPPSKRAVTLCEPVDVVFLFTEVSAGRRTLWKM